MVAGRCAGRARENRRCGALNAISLEAILKEGGGSASISGVHPIEAQHTRAL